MRHSQEEQAKEGSEVIIRGLPGLLEPHLGEPACGLKGKRLQVQPSQVEAEKLRAEEEPVGIRAL